MKMTTKKSVHVDSLKKKGRRKKLSSQRVENLTDVDEATPQNESTSIEKGAQTQFYGDDGNGDGGVGSESNEHEAEANGGGRVERHDEDEDDERNHEGAAEESDSSEDEVPPLNTVGDVPLEWYKDEEHIGYDIAGRKIKKKERLDKLDSFLASIDDSENWRKIYDDYNDEEVELTKQEIKFIKRMMQGKAPHADFDPHAPYIDWFQHDGKHPLSNAPEPKRRFIDSKWERKKIVKYVRAIRKGLIKLDQPKEEKRIVPLWGDDSGSIGKAGGLAYIPPPKMKLPGHEESYNPSLEYIPTQEEIDSYQLMFEEDRPTFIPKRFTSLKSVPAYENALKDTFQRCLDLYLCPRVRRKRLNIDPESLKPKLPNKKDLRPYPNICYLEYKGHTGPVLSISTDSSGQWFASGSTDGTVRIWEVETGRCVKVWELGSSVQYVAWNPLSEQPIVAAVVGHVVFVLNTGLGTDEQQKTIEDLLHVGPATQPDESDDSKSIMSWLKDDKYGGIKLEHFKSVTSVEWHRKGDYFSTVMPAGESKAVLIHQLSKKLTQKIPFKLHGLPVTSIFHPTRSIFFIATKKTVRAYDLVKKKLIKKLESGVREISSIAIHPGGDNVIVGSNDGKLCWFDMDLSSKPYKVLKCHSKDITNVAFHRSYPIFATSSHDCSAYVFHGMVYSDLNQNPLIVPLEVLKGHTSSKEGGVNDCKFHPRQPWLFTAGADSLIKLYCH
uniref:Ribosome biogenesis protein BOP1 homolog n=1 Tax=Kalanchoe fedtschenkoi TaxID=63787 RepID=A0A7N0V2K0_KALFE